MIIKSPNNFCIENGIYVFHNILYNGDEIIVINNPRPDYNFELERILEIYIDGVKLQNTYFLKEDGDGGFCVLKYECPFKNDQINIHVKYKNQEKSFLLKNDFKEIIGKYAITTLFKNDQAYLPVYVNYYYNLGVRVFVLYFNDDISNLKIEESNIPSDATLIIYEWNYRYMMCSVHLSQISAINNTVYCLKDKVEYLINADFDEYIFLNGGTIEEASGGIISKFSYFNIDYTPDSFKKAIQEEFFYTAVEDPAEKSRAKWMYKNDSNLFAGVVHEAKVREIKENKREGIFIAHFASLYHKDRSGWIKERIDNSPNIKMKLT
jgi:hypothetical protein